MGRGSSDAPGLRRTFNLPLLVLYGVGTTVGAGIYALLGEISARAGSLAPWSFLLASLLAALTAVSFAELSRRYPRSAATAMYIQKGFRSQGLGAWAGYLVASAGIVSGAALLNGMASYLQILVEVRRELVIVPAAVLLALLTVWGMVQSALVAALICLIEVGGLLWVCSLAIGALEPTQIDWAPLVPTLDALPAVSAGAVLAFYAYIGFEDMVEVAEEVKDVRRTLPRAIILTLLVTTVLYIFLVVSAQLALSAPVLAASEAPMAQAYATLTGRDPWAITLIGVVAIVNGVLIQMIMASRVFYGLANRGQAPALLQRVNPVTQTPVLATVLTALLVVLLALAGDISALAQLTSVIMLVLFAMANLSLWLVKRRLEDTQLEGFRLPKLVPFLAFLVCAGVAVRGLSDLLS